MKLLVSAALLVSATVSADPDCASRSREQFVAGWEEADAQQRLHHRITPGGIVNCTYFPDQEQHLNVLARHEQGVLNGAEYKVYYTDGSAVIQGEAGTPLSSADYTDNWRLACKNAGAGNPYHCTLRKGDLLLRQDADDRLSLNVGEQHQRGSQLLLRVDTNWAVTAPADAGFSTEQTDKLLAQLRTGKQVDTRYQHAARQGASDQTISLFGFGPALQILGTVLDQLNAPPASAN
jgi:hypothetical protein